MARIRTIKPEFWAHEELSALPESVHILAAALLNYADDDGYFNANAQLIKAVCFPIREPSCPITVGLRYLSGIGYIRLGRGEDGKDYGHIVKFKNHQVINKHRKSKLSMMSITWTALPEDYRSTTVVLPEDYRQEWNGTGNGMDITTTATAKIFIDCFAQNESRIRQLYPHADYEAERETCIAHYRSGPPPLDCYPVILKWFQRVKKPKQQQPLKTFEQQKMENTRRAAMEFAGEDVYDDGPGQKSICIDDGWSGGSIPV